MTEVTELNAAKIWRFRALDTWFFRESRPMESVGGSELISTFPPSPRTLAGAIRHLVGNRHAVDWKQWGRTDSYPELKQRIGDADGYGDLCLSGAWLARETVSGSTERLYPVPGNLVIKQETAAPKRAGGTEAAEAEVQAGTDEPEMAGKVLKLARLRVGQPRRCNLGDKVRMPVLPKDPANPEQYLRMRSADDYWVTEQGLQQILAGGVCQAEALIAADCLFNKEARLGIAINNRQRAVEQGLLYQTRHVRPEQSVLVEVDVAGLQAADHDSQGVVRLGGEGRGAGWSVHEFAGLRPAAIRPDEAALAQARGIILVTLTPADWYPAVAVSTENYSPLPGFIRDDNHEKWPGATVWTGILHGVDLTLHSAVLGKPVREGGWDLVSNSPRAVRSLVPAGSVFYLTVDSGDIQGALQQLHLKQVPEQPPQAPEDKQEYALGRGLVAVGLWPDNEYESVESVEQE